MLDYILILAAGACAGVLFYGAEYKTSFSVMAGVGMAIVVALMAFVSQLGVILPLAAMITLCIIPWKVDVEFDLSPKVMIAALTALMIIFSYFFATNLIAAASAWYVKPIALTIAIATLLIMLLAMVEAKAAFITVAVALAVAIWGIFCYFNVIDKQEEVQIETPQVTQTEEPQYTVDTEYVDEMLNKHRFTEKYSTLTADSYPESSQASKEAYWAGICEESSDGNYVVNPLMLASSSNYLQSIGFDCNEVSDSEQLYNDNTVTEYGMETLEKVEEVVFDDNTFIYTAEMQDAEHKVNTGSSASGTVYATQIGITGNTDCWVVTTRTAMFNAIEQTESGDEIVMSDEVAMQQMLRCGNVVVSSNNVPNGARKGQTDQTEKVVEKEKKTTNKTTTSGSTNTTTTTSDSGTTTPSNLKDKTKGVQGQLVAPNDDTGPGPDTNNGVGATTSTKHPTASSTDLTSYTEYTKKINEIKSVNTTQKTGSSASTPTITVKSGVKVDNNGDTGNKKTGSASINTPTTITKQATDTNGNSVSSSSGEVAWNAGGEFGPE